MSLIQEWLSANYPNMALPDATRAFLLEQVGSSYSYLTIPELWSVYFDQQGILTGAALPERFNVWFDVNNADPALRHPLLAAGVGGGGGSYPADLAFYALDTQNGSFVADVIVGDGSITEAATSTRYYPDASNVWQAYGSGVVGRYYHDGDWWYPFHAPWTNSCQHSYDLTNAAWTKTNATAALTQAGMRGDANGASLLTATAANGTAIYSAVTAASNPHGSRWFLKRSVGTGTVEITMDNGSTWTDITAALAAATGWYEAVVSQTLTNPQIGIRLGTSGDAVIVGNAELAIDPSAGTETPTGILRMNSPIFTNGSTGSVDETIPTVPGSNHDNSIGFYYVECFIPSNDADYGLTDTYFPSFDATASDATPNNFANGSVWSSQYLQPAAGGSTTQVTRSVVAGDRLRVTSWYNAAESSARYALDGDLSAGALAFSSFDSDGTFYIIRRQRGGAYSGTVLIRNMRRYVIADMAAGTSLSVNLVHGEESWGQNLVVLSDRLDLYVNKGNSWTATGTTCARNAVGLEGLANTACTITDPDASLRIFQQASIPVVADTRNYTVRVFIRKDAVTSRFPEIQFKLSGGTTVQGFVQINTSTGASASRVGNSATWTVQTYAYNTDFWEVVGTMANNGTNAVSNILFYPAYASTLGGASSAALTGSIVVGNVELYPGKVTADVIGQDPAYTPQTKAPEVNPS